MGSFWKAHGLKPFVRMAILGDDNFSIVSRTHVLRVFGSIEAMRVALVAWATDLGYKLKVGVTDNVVKAEFLSSRYYPVGNGHAIGKKPGRVLAKIGYQLFTQGRQPAEYLRNLKGTLISYVPSSNHVPFLRVYIREMLRHLSSYDALLDAEAKHRQQGELYEADETTWAAFEAVYGFGPGDEQVFADELKQHIARFGLTSVMVSHHVAELFRIDFAGL
jgi:hypothetical protein